MSIPDATLTPGDAELADRLVASGRLTPAQLQWCLEQQRLRGGASTVSLRDILRERGVLAAGESDATLVTPGPGAEAGADAPASAPPSGTSRSEPPELAAASSDPGRRLGRYVLLAELGRGGMGVVHRGWDAELRRLVAIKMILDPGRAGPEAIARFRREAQATARLRHPGIIAVHEVGEHRTDGRVCPFLVMDFVDGATLDAVLEQERPPPRRIAEIIRAVADALGHAHDLGIIHRDIKPQNVMIDRAGRPLVMDFGLARDATETHELTRTGQLLGTPSYMAPEQAGASRGAHGPATDVYALGAVLYRALTGRVPFEAPNAMGIIKKVLFDDPTPPRQLDPSIHVDLETIALRCLEKEPARRYPIGGEVRDELDRFLRGEAIHARPIGRRERAGRWVRRHRLTSAALAAVLVALVTAPVAAVALARRATRRERARLVAAAGAEADAALATFRQTAAREERADAPDALIAGGLEALEAAGRLAMLAPADPEARRRRFDAAMLLGEVARDAEQWSVAVTAFSVAAGAAGEADPDGLARAEAALADAEAGRGRILEEHRAEVEAILAAARRSGLADREEYQDALFRITSLREPQTVALLVAALDAESATLRAARADALRAARPTPDEARAGLAPITGLEDALARLDALAPGESLDATAAEAIAAASRRLVEREGREASLGIDRHETSARALLASAQERAAGSGAVALARLCCEALGRLGLDVEGAVDALGRHLLAGEDPRRAIPAGTALCRIGGGLALAIVDAAIARFGRAGPFGVAVARYRRRLASGSSGAPDAAERGPSALEVGIAALESGDAAAAETLLAGAVAERPDLALAWARLGDARAALGRLEDAEAAYGRAIEGDAGLVIAWVGRALARRRRHDHAGALADASRAVQLDPGEVGGWLARAEARMGSRDLEAALADVAAAIARAPDDGRPWALRGHIRLAQGRLAEAIDDLGHALERDGGVAEVWQARGQARLRTGDLAGAISDLEAAARLTPEDADVIADLGVARREARDLPGALADLGRALELDPEHSEALYHRSSIHRMRGDLVAARSDLERCIRVAPGMADAWTERGNVLGLAGKLDEADASYGRAIELDPRQRWALVGRGTIASKRGDHRRAIELYGEAIEVAPDFAAAWFNRGHTRYVVDDYEAAIVDFTRAIELDERFANAWQGRGAVSMQLGRLEEALADLDRAIALDPGYSVAWLNRGLTRERLGDAAGAAGDLRRFLELSPRGGPADHAREVLARLEGQ